MKSWTSEDRILAILFFLTGAIFIYGLSLPLLGFDSSQYAELSRQMNESGNYFQIQLDGRDYLDKPPLLFWLSSITYSFLGISEFAFRFPSFLFSLIGVYGTYIIGKELYNKRTGKYAALMLMTALASFMVNIDVRTDTLLIGSVTFATAKFIQYRLYSRWSDLIISFFFIGLAMCSKGPIGLMIPIIAIGTEILFKKDWRSILDWKLIIGLFITFITILPILLGLYYQWDLHPEKELYDQNNVSGVRFYLWDQSFGRITGNNPFVNQMKEIQITDPTYFIHTLLWALLPWTLLGFSGLLKNIFSIFKKVKLTEYYTLGATIIPVIILSFSSFKLPHYIFICLPFFCVLGANFFISKYDQKWIKYIQFVIMFIFVIAIFILLAYSFPTQSLLPWIILIIVALIMFLYIIKNLNAISQITFISLSTIMVHLIIYTHFYPILLEYDSGIKAGEYLKKVDQQITLSYDNNQNDQNWKTFSYSLEFYSNNINKMKFKPKDLIPYKDQDYWIYTSENEMIELKKLGWIKEIKKYKHILTSRIGLDFFVPYKRNIMIENKYLIKI